MKNLVTKRLLLRSWNEKDAKDFFEYAKNPKVGYMAGWKPHGSVKESKEIIKRFLTEGNVWAICNKQTEKAIGSVGLHKDSKRALDPRSAMMLGYALSEQYWGKGLMTEACSAVMKYAFEELELKILSVDHFPFNNRSRRVIEKLGFIYEGTLRQSFVNYNGEILDDVCYSITQDEYKGLHNV